jgi:hypothetical protein
MPTSQRFPSSAGPRELTAAAALLRVAARPAAGMSFASTASMANQDMPPPGRSEPQKEPAREPEKRPPQREPMPDEQPMRDPKIRKGPVGDPDTDPPMRRDPPAPGQAPKDPGIIAR